MIGKDKIFSTFEKVAKSSKADQTEIVFIGRDTGLRYLQELDTDEISRILGVSKNTLNVRLSRARKRLKEDLAELIEQ